MSILCCFLFCALLHIGTTLNHDCLKQVLFSSKTPYKLIENLDLHIEKPKHSCKAVQINMIHRHGNRYPSAKDVRNINIAAEKLNQAVDTFIPANNFKLPWTSPFHTNQDKSMSQIGELELYQLGSRLRLRFPELFTKRYTPQDFSFASSCKLRCTHSSNALSIGLFENTGVLGDCGMQPISIETYPCNNDPKLRFFEMCSKYRKEVVNNKTALIEYHNFEAGIEFQSVIEKVKFKLGLPKSNLDANDISSLFIACAYEIGMFNGSLDQGICSLFNEEDRRVIEFAYDLKHFYKRSAGHKINFESSCSLLKDIINSLESVITNTSHVYKGIFRSSHAETIMPLYALLGVYLDDIKITSKNYAKMKYRKFRAGCIAPFSGHLYFVLYKCDNSFKIQMYLNERLVKIPCCESKESCDVDVVLKCYKDIVDSCQFKKICNLEKQVLKKNEL